MQILYKHNFHTTFFFLIVLYLCIVFCIQSKMVMFNKETVWKILSRTPTEPLHFIQGFIIINVKSHIVLIVLYMAGQTSIEKWVKKELLSTTNYSAYNRIGIPTIIWEMVCFTLKYWFPFFRTCYSMYFIHINKLL